MTPLLLASLGLFGCGGAGMAGAGVGQTGGGAAASAGTGGAGGVVGGITRVDAGSPIDGAVGVGGPAASGTAGGPGGGRRDAGVGGVVGPSSPDGGVGVGGAASPGTSAPDSGAAGVGVGPCATAPVTPNATPQARNVLCYLYSQYRNHILSGQEENASGQASAAEVEVSYIFKTTGKYPVVRSFDVNNAGNATRCLAWWQANGLCVFGYHMGAPGVADGYQGSMTAVPGGINTVLMPGSANNLVFNQRLDKLAAEVLQVEQGGGVVILRMFHEAGGTWFWWSKEGGAQYVRLWQYAFNYLTTVKGLKGILWLMPYDGTPQASFYPGKTYLDLAGADNYNASDDYSPMTSIFNAMQGIAGMTVPIALHENGPIPDPDLLQSSKTEWLYFNTWTAPFPENATSVAEMQKIYSSSYVVTRDEMPSLR